MHVQYGPVHALRGIDLQVREGEIVTLMLDEPSLGLAPIYIRKIFEIIHEINRKDGVSILLVEQNAHHALRLAHRGYVLQHGNVAGSEATGHRFPHLPSTSDFSPPRRCHHRKPRDVERELAGLRADRRANSHASSSTVKSITCTAGCRS